MFGLAHLNDEFHAIKKTLADLKQQSGSAGTAKRGVTELSEGTVRTVYIDTPLVGAKGYVVADWEKGQVRIEVQNFPVSDTGYEAFLFEIDVPAYMGKMFINGDKKVDSGGQPPLFLKLIT